MEIKNLVFDMGNVLIQYNAQHYIEKYVPDKADWELMRREVFDSVEWVRMDHGTLSQTQAVASCCRRLPARLHSVAARLYADWNKEIAPMPGMEELVARAKCAGYGIYLLSNTSVRYHHFRKNIPALRWFDGEFISADWRMLKPDPAIYRTFCHHFRLIPTQCLMIDDTPANVYGAQLAGMRGVVFYGEAAELEARLALYGVAPAKTAKERNT